MDINTTLTSLFNAILPSLSILIGALVSYLLVKATTKLKAQTKIIQDKATRDLADKTLDTLTHLVSVNVTSAGETIVKELKASTLDGVLNKEDAKNILEIVKGKVVTQLSESGKEALSTTISDLDGYIESAIETALKQIKAQTAPYTTSSSYTTDVAPMKTTSDITTSDGTVIGTATVVSPTEGTFVSVPVETTPVETTPIVR